MSGGISKRLLSMRKKSQEAWQTMQRRALIRKEICCPVLYEDDAVLEDYFSGKSDQVYSLQLMQKLPERAPPAMQVVKGLRTRKSNKAPVPVVVKREKAVQIDEPDIASPEGKIEVT